MSEKAVFLDRDGVVIRDVHLLTRPYQVALCEGAGEAIRKLKEAGYLAVVVTNQTVVSRGLATEDEVDEVHNHIQMLLREEAGVMVDKFYTCPHHPKATLEKYRVECQCRKPRPGMLLAASGDLDIDCSRSFMVSDRISDIAAGKRAGCTAIMVLTGKHEDAPIESPDGIDPELQPDTVCDSLLAAAEWILHGQPEKK